MSLKTDTAKTKADAEVVEADVEQDVKDAEADAVANVRQVANVSEAEAKRVVAEVRKILGLKTSSDVNQHVDGTADQRSQDEDRADERARDDHPRSKPFKGDAGDKGAPVVEHKN
jgi:hypothetical protein